MDMHPINSLYNLWCHLTELVSEVGLCQKDGKEVRNTSPFNRRAEAVWDLNVLRGGKFPKNGSCYELDFDGALLRFEDNAHQLLVELWGDAVAQRE